MRSSSVLPCEAAAQPGWDASLTTIPRETLCPDRGCGWRAVRRAAETRSGPRDGRPALQQPERRAGRDGEIVNVGFHQITWAATTIEASDLFLKARVLEARRGDGIRRALDLFGEVLKVDPTFVSAYAGFANATAESSFAEDIPQDQPDSVLRVAALRAIALDPLLAEAQAAMGHVHACAGEWPEAERSFRRALELNPSLTTTYTDLVLSTLLPEGKLDEAMRQLEVALRGDPRSLDVRRVLANVQISAGLYDRALENAQTVLAIDPTFPYVSMFRARALLFKGQRTEALRWLEAQGTDVHGYLDMRMQSVADGQRPRRWPEGVRTRTTKARGPETIIGSRHLTVRRTLP